MKNDTFSLKIAFLSLLYIVKTNAWEGSDYNRGLNCKSPLIIFETWYVVSFLFLIINGLDSQHSLVQVFCLQYTCKMF